MEKVAANSQDVAKVTLYMTTAQWNAMSAWNIKNLEMGKETWLFLSHESGKEKECDDALARLHADQAQSHPLL